MPRPNTGPRLKSVPGRRNLYIVWFEHGRERRESTGTTDSREAEAVLLQFIAEREIRRRPAGPARPNEYLIASALDLYGTLHAPNTRDPERIAYAMVPLLEYWGDQSVDAITKATCKAYEKWRDRAPATVRRELVVLKAALNFAKNEGRLTLVPPVELPLKPSGKDRWLTVNEAARLLNAARTGRSDTRLYLPLFIQIGLKTGARPGAILSLRWPQVDLDRRVIEWPDDEPQTNKRKVKVQPIPDSLMTFLRLARQRGTDLGYVVHLHGNRIRDIGGAWNGDPESPGNGSFGNACKRAGIANVSPHALRHTCGTWMAQRGVPLHQIGGWLGHTDVRTTALYAHHHPDHMEEARRAADRRK